MVLTVFDLRQDRDVNVSISSIWVLGVIWLRKEPPVLQAPTAGVELPEQKLYWNAVFFP